MLWRHHIAIWSEKIEFSSMISYLTIFFWFYLELSTGFCNQTWHTVNLDISKWILYSFTPIHTLTDACARPKLAICFVHVQSKGKWIIHKACICSSSMETYFTDVTQYSKYMLCILHACSSGACIMAILTEPIEAIVSSYSFCLCLWCRFLVSVSVFEFRKKIWYVSFAKWVVSNG